MPVPVFAKRVQVARFQDGRYVYPVPLGNVRWRGLQTSTLYGIGSSVVRKPLRPCVK
ncbi:MAG: hypothetical protein QGG39_00960 [Candidatus Poribacteria bacterium]|nr:hypothetical protein [Candidatus Poribacteria bacterium]